MNKLGSAFLGAAGLIAGKKNILKKHTFLAVAAMMFSLTAVFLMTGVLYFRNEVTITDGNETTRVYTMLDNPDEIIAENEIELGELDRYEFSGVADDGTAQLKILRSVDVFVNADGAEKTVECPLADSVKDILVRAGITLEEYDMVDPSLDTPMYNGQSVTVTRAYTAKVTADGKTTELKTSGETAEQLIARAGITIGQDDYANVPLDTIIGDGDEVVVTRVKFVNRITLEAIPYESLEEYSNLLPIGYSEVTTEGVNGGRTTTTLEKYVDGVLVSSSFVCEQVVAEPVNEVTTYGKALATPYSKRDFPEVVLENGIPANYQYIVSGKSCAYTAREGAGTASGRKLQIGTVAVNPDIIPYGSLLYIVTQDHRTVYGVAIAADTGYLTDVVTDLYMGTTAEHYSDACRWGARQVDIYVIAENYA